MSNNIDYFVYEKSNEIDKKIFKRELGFDLTQYPINVVNIEPLSQHFIDEMTKPKNSPG